MLVTFIAQFAQVICLAFLALTLPLSPIGIALLAGNVRYLQNYRSTIKRHARMIIQMAKANVIARGVVRKLSPKLILQAVANQRIVGDCTHCGQCCIHKSCVYLEFDGANHSRCGIYNNWFWKKTNCGDYPISAHEIAVYDCPSYRSVAVAETEASVNVITLHRHANRKAAPIGEDEIHAVIPIKRTPTPTPIPIPIPIPIPLPGHSIKHDVAHSAERDAEQDKNTKEKEEAQNNRRTK